MPVISDWEKIQSRPLFQELDESERKDVKLRFWKERAMPTETYQKRSPEDRTAMFRGFFSEEFEKLPSVAREFSRQIGPVGPVERVAEAEEGLPQPELPVAGERLFKPRVKAAEEAVGKITRAKEVYLKEGQTAIKFQQLKSMGMPEPEAVKKAEEWDWADIFRWHWKLEPGSPYEERWLHHFGPEVMQEIAEFSTQPHAWATAYLVGKALPAGGRFVWKRLPIGVQRVLSKEIKVGSSFSNWWKAKSPTVRAKLGKMSDVEFSKMWGNDNPQAGRVFRTLPKARQQNILRLMRAERGYKAAPIPAEEVPVPETFGEFPIVRAAEVPAAVPAPVTPVVPPVAEAPAEVPAAVPPAEVPAPVEAPPITLPTPVTPVPAEAVAGEFDLSIVKDAAKAIQRQLGPSRGLSAEQLRIEGRRAGGVAARHFESILEVKELNKSLKKLDPGVREAAMEAYLGQRPIEELPPKVGEVVKAMRRRTDKLSKMMVRLEIPKESTREVIASNIGEYATRSYKIFDQGYVPTKADRAHFQQEYLKKELGIPDEELESMTNAIITGLQTKGSVGFGGKGKRISQASFKQRKDVPEALRRLMGERTDITDAYAATMTRMIPIVENGMYFIRLKNAGIASDVQTEGKPYRLGTEDSWSYGALRGMYVDKATYDEVTGIVDNTAGKVSLLEKIITNPWKFTKTVGRPATHGRNIMGNFIFSLNSDTSIFNPLNLPHYIQAGDVVARSDSKYRALWKTMLKYEIVGTEYVGADLRAFGRRLSVSKDPIDTLWEWGKKPFKAAAWLYNSEDVVFKVANAIKLRKQGVPWPEISRRTSAAYQNYRRVPRALQKLRRQPLGARFISFQSEAARIALSQPAEIGRAWQEPGVRPKLRAAKKAVMWPASWTSFGMPFVETLGSLGTIGLALAWYYGINIKEIRKLQKQEEAKTWLKHRSFIYWRDEDGKVKRIDMTYIDPHGEQKRLIADLLDGDIISIPEQLIGQTELFNFAVGLLTGKDWYFDKKIWPVDAENKEKAIAYAKWLAGNMAMGTQEAREMRRWKTGQLTGTEALGRAFVGIRTETVNPGETYRYYIFKKKKIMEEIMKETRGALLSKTATAEEKAEALRRLPKRLGKQAQKLREETK